MNATDNPPRVHDALLAGAQLVLTGIMLYAAVRAVAGPDAGRAMSLRVWRTGENLCQGQAVAWARAADACKIMYDKARPVLA